MEGEGESKGLAEGGKWHCNMVALTPSTTFSFSCLGLLGEMGVRWVIVWPGYHPGLRGRAWGGGVRARVWLRVESGTVS